MFNLLYNLATDKYQGPLAAIAKFILFIISLVYSFIVRILVFINQNRQQRLKLKVISIGNITLGGTGKTTLVEFVARHLKEKGHNVAILSRGYKRLPASQKPEVKGQEAMGDEPYMLKNNLTDVPVLVDVDRIRAANAAVNNYAADTVVLDDGFQQWGIKKDLEIVAIDATNPFGNRQIIPRGIMREPLTSLKRADIFVITKTNLNFHTQQLISFLNQVNPGASVFKAIHRPRGFYNLDLDNENELLKPDAFSGKTVALVCGIGDPESFKNLVTSLNMNIGLVFVFADHHPYTYKDIELISRKSQQAKIDTIITTQKDSVRLKPYLYASLKSKPGFFVLRIQLEIVNDEQKFFHRLQRIYSA